MPQRQRPLSPHMLVYKFPLAGMMSGSHRVTGLLLALGTLPLTYWLLAAAYGPGSFAEAQSIFGSWLGLLALTGWMACLYYHLVNGIRHLIWDTGQMLEKESLITSGYVTFAATAGLTVGTIVAAFVFVS